jgi:hypothetical protein
MEDFVRLSSAIIPVSDESFSPNKRTINQMKLFMTDRRPDNLIILIPPRFRSPSRVQNYPSKFASLIKIAVSLAQF